MKAKLKQYIRKQKFLIYFLIALIGIILIIVACAINFSSQDPSLLTDIEQYDILIGIGCSFISSAAVTIFLLVILPGESDDISELQDWGIRAIYKEREEIKISLKGKHPKRNLDFIAFGLNHFIENNSKEEVVKKIENGLNIRIITLNPYSIYVSEQEKIENNYKIKSDILKLIRWVKEINDSATGNQIKIKFYDAIPQNFYCRSDDTVYVGPYLANRLSGNLITYQFDFESKGGTYFSSIFDEIWENKSSVQVIDKVTKCYYVRQKESVTSILKYFCDRLPKGKNQETIIGVIAIFKDGYRRTFFSCNKPHKEKYKVHQKNEGTVGVLINQFEDPNIKNSSVFNDYDNQIAFAKNSQTRVKNIQILPNSAVKLDNNAETVAVLATSLFRDEELIGVLTFDYVELPEGYSQKVNDYKKQKDEANYQLTLQDSDTLNILFNEIEDCAKMVVNLLGQEIETEYKELYMEDWN